MKKDIKLSVTYQSDLTKIRDDMASLKSIRRQLESTPIKLPVRLDLTGIRSDAVKAAQAYHAELTKAMAAVKPGQGGGMSAGGIAIPASSLGNLKQFANSSGAELKRIETQFTDSKAKIVKTFEQLERGLAQTTTIRTDKKGNIGKPIVTQVDTRPIEAFRKAMSEIESKFGPQIGAAKGGKGDVASVLEQKKKAIDAKLTEFAHMEGSPAYQQARQSLIRLDQTLSQTGASQNRAAQVKKDKDAKLAANEVRRNYKTFAERTIHNEDRKLQSDIKLNKGDEAAAKAIQNRIVREKELNRILDDREKLISKQQARYLVLQESAVAGGHGEAANQFHNAAARMANDLGQVQLDRKRAASSAARANDSRDLDRLLAQTLRYNEQQRASLQLEEKHAQLITRRSKREEALNSIISRRSSLLDSTRNTVADVYGKAAMRGDHALMGKAEAADGRLAKQAIRDRDHLASATNRSTHANQFHSSSLLKNAISFTRWTLAMTAVTAPLAAIGSGTADAVKLERTFKTLNAVFRGSREDAKLLADQTLQLAAANGRDGQEAAEAAIAWSRLGLTRTQTLMAVETSLRAANVAEITAAEATGYLTASYKSFHQTVLDIPATLDYLNSLSNSNADKVKDMFNAIARGGKVAGDAGLSLQRYAAISATVGEATQRPGAEFGNASKSIFNRIRKAETMDSLKSQFGLDFTTATGEIQSMDQILLKLAQTYSELSATQKANLTVLIAGSNQSNRAATMLDTYTDSLVAEAVASADSNSAMRENAQLLDSVDAKLQSIATSWSALFVSLGESGAFDFIKDAIGSTETLIKLLNDARNTGGAGKTSGNPFDKIDTLTAFLVNSNNAGSRVHSLLSGDFSKSLGDDLSIQDIRNASRSLRQSGMRSVADSIDKALNETGHGNASPDSPAQRIIESEGRINSLSASAQAYKAMGLDTYSKDPDRVITSFNKSLPAYKVLQDGEKAMFSAEQEVRPLLESGNMPAARTALAKRQEMFEKAMREETARLEEMRPAMAADAQSTVTASRSKLASLESSKVAAAGDTDRQSLIQSEITRTNALLQSQEEALKVISRVQEKVVSTEPFDKIKGSLSSYTAELKLAAEVYAEMVTGFGNTGFADLDAKLKIGSSRMEALMFQEAVAASHTRNATGRAESQRILDVAVNRKPNEFLTPEMTREADEKLITTLQEQLALYDQIEDSLFTQVTERNKATREEERKLEFARQTARIKEVYDDSAESIKSGSQRFAIGRNEGQRIANQTFGMMAELRGSLTGNATSPVDAASKLGALTERLQGSKSGLLSLEDRLNRALAERANLEYEISEQAVKQREEASKRLALASREDQLRAAASAAFLRNNGRSSYSMQEFQYFSQETRGAISNIAPQTVKGLDDDGKENNRKRGDLDQEIKLLEVSLASLRQSFAPLRADAERRGGELGEKLRPNAPLPELNKNEIKLQLSTGDVKINFDLAPHIQSIVTLLTPKISSEVTTAFNRLTRDLGMRGAPDTSAAAGVR